MNDLPACETLKLAVDHGILHVTLDRPETKNALNKAMVRDLTAAVDYARRAHRYPRRRGARCERHVLLGRRHQWLQGIVLDAAA